MENVDDVWVFLEKKIKSSVPAYIKNILKVCGYDNVLAIASIVEDDIKYFEEEVRNGNVMKYFESEKESNILDGSTKSVENFEFPRGHKQFLIFIRDFLGRYLKENGPDSLLLDVPSRKKNQDAAPKDMNRDIKIHQGILMCKIIMRLINTTPDLYADHMELINNKISNELVKMQLKLTNSANDKIPEDLSALIYCPLCSTTVTAFHKPTAVNKFLWNISNFDGHLELVHLNKAECIESNSNGRVKDEAFETIEQDFQTEKNSRENNFITNCTRTSLLKRVECNGNRGKKANEKFRSIVNYSDTSADDEDLQPYSEILKASSVGSLKFEQTKIVPTSCKSLKSKHFPKNHAEDLTKELNGYDKKNDVLFPQLGNYVICSLFVKETIRWPAKSNIMKNFVGKICGMKDTARNIKTKDEIDIQLLSKSCYSKVKFNYPQNIETTRISKSRIVKILDDPLQNRRGEFVFEDKSILDYVF